jgi:1-acyl-sn-glycerol-3-phosphate acyltransferase
MARAMNVATLIKKIFKNLIGLLAFLVITLNTFVWFGPIILCAFVKFLIPFAPLKSVMSRWIMVMGENWVSFNALVCGVVNNTVWDIRGLDDLNRRGWYLLVVNHQTWVDIVVAQTVLRRRIPFLKFFIKKELIWFPVLGITWWAMDMPFMQRRSNSYLKKHPEEKGKDLEATRKACEKFRDTPTSVINFLEGTRFSEEKRVARKSDFKYLLPPRAGGAALAIASMGTMFDAILDVTIVYPKGVIKFWDMFCGDLEHVVIDIRKRPVEEWMLAGDYANDREFRRQFHRWLTTVWSEKDERMAQILSETKSS